MKKTIAACLLALLLTGQAWAGEITIRGMEVDHELAHRGVVGGCA